MRGRQIERSIVLMQDILATAEAAEDASTNESPAAVRLDFLTAYDTLDRNF